VAIYDQIAPIYDQTRGQEALPWASVALAWLRSPAVVIDIGVGTGLTTAPIEAAGHKVIGTDVSGGMLEIARHRSPEAVLVRADAVRIPIRDMSVDRAVALQVFQLIHEPIFLLADIRRILRPGGELLAAPIVGKGPTDPINRTYWKAMLAAGGFGTVRHFVAAGRAAGFGSHRIVEGEPRSRTTTPNDEADRLDGLWGGTPFSEAFRNLPDPDRKVQMEMTIQAVVLVR
jgi:ubiquinone/menaquinone biosynthesis C-methylase UbiE